MDKIVRVNVPPEVTLATVFVIWKDANGVQVKEENLPFDTLENYPKQSEAQFNALLAAFAELKEENKKLKEKEAMSGWTTSECEGDE